MFTAAVPAAAEHSAYLLVLSDRLYVNPILAARGCVDSVQQSQARSVAPDVRCTGFRLGKVVLWVRSPETGFGKVALEVRSHGPGFGNLAPDVYSIGLGCTYKIS